MSIPAFCSAVGSHVENLAGFILGLRPAAEPTPADATGWVELSRALDPRSAPWHQGYELAEACLERLGVDTSRPIDIDRILEDLGVDRYETVLEDIGIRGLAAASPTHVPSIAVNVNYPRHERVEIRRFTKAHELCHILFDRSAAREVCKASGPWAPLEVEQRANAFAAMLLMPEALLRSTAGLELTMATDLDDLAREAETFQVSRLALLRHGINLGLLPTQLLETAAAHNWVSPRRLRVAR